MIRVPTLINLREKIRKKTKTLKMKKFIIMEMKMMTKKKTSKNKRSKREEMKLI
jgi:hypothetical protein